MSSKNLRKQLFEEVDEFYRTNPHGWFGTASKPGLQWESTTEPCKEIDTKEVKCLECPFHVSPPGRNTQCNLSTEYKAYKNMQANLEFIKGL